MSSERAGNLAEIRRLCTEIEQAVDAAKWDVAGHLLSRRHQLLESVFAEPVTTPAEAGELRALAEQVIAFDCELMPVADAARSETTEDLKKLRRGRVASQAYNQNSS